MTTMNCEILRNKRWSSPLLLNYGVPARFLSVNMICVTFALRFCTRYSFRFRLPTGACPGSRTRLWQWILLHYCDNKTEQKKRFTLQVFIPCTSIIFALLFSLPPSRNSDPGSHSRLFSPPTHYGSCLAFLPREDFSFLPSLTRVVLTHARRSQQLILLFLQINWNLATAGFEPMDQH